MTAYGRQRQPGKIDPLAVSIGYATVVLGDAPVAFWRLNDASAVDSVAGRDVTWGNGPTAADGPVGVARATAFNGTSQYGQTASASALVPTGDISIETWAYLTSTSGSRSVLGATPTTGNPIAWGFDLSSGKWRFILGDGAGNPYASISDPADAVTGQWYHLVGTFQASGTASKLYVNGAQVASSTSTAGTRYTTPCPVQIGRYNQTWSQFFPGRLAACALYNAVLSAAQVTNHYSAGA